MTYILCFTDEAKKDLAGIKKNEPAVFIKAINRINSPTIEKMLVGIFCDDEYLLLSKALKR